jgi:hypothetical protein
MWRITGKCVLTFEDTHRTHAKNRCPICVMGIEPVVIFPVEISDNTTGNGDTHSKNIDENKEFILHQIPNGDQQEILYHTQAFTGNRRKMVIDGCNGPKKKQR